MTTLTAAQIAGHAKAAGFAAQDLVIAVAIALGESGGRTDAKGDVSLQTGTWGPSIGLWQIRSLVADKGTGKTRDELANYDAAHNARAAYTLYKGRGGFADWSVYNSGAYKNHLSVARGGASAATGTASTPASSQGGYEAVRVVGWASPAPWNSTVAGIARQYGHGSDWQTVWMDARNAGLRKLRGAPGQIRAGDVVYVKRR
jgi:hypothetical protein